MKHVAASKVSLLSDRPRIENGVAFVESDCESDCKRESPEIRANRYHNSMARGADERG